jgi:hypothetical protein
MSLSPLLPIAGTALGVVADRAIDAVKEGLSFLDVLRDAPASETEAPQASTPAPVDPSGLIASLREHFARLGIDLSNPVPLKQDGQGGVIVDGEHPNRVLIESLFNTHGELTEQFHALAIALAEEAGNNEYDSEDFRLVIDGAREAIGFG